MPQPQPNRRRTDLAGRIARATWPLRQVPVGEILAAAPCKLFGHRWVEIPKTLRRSIHSDGEAMRFKCSRCFLVGGFTA